MPRRGGRGGAPVGGGNRDPEVALGLREVVLHQGDVYGQHQHVALQVSARGVREGARACDGGRQNVSRAYCREGRQERGGGSEGEGARGWKRVMITRSVTPCLSAHGCGVRVSGWHVSGGGWWVVGGWRAGSPLIAGHDVRFLLERMLAPAPGSLVKRLPTEPIRTLYTSADAGLESLPPVHPHLQDMS